MKDTVILKKLRNVYRKLRLDYEKGKINHHNQALTDEQFAIIIKAYRAAMRDLADAVLEQEDREKA